VVNNSPYIVIELHVRPATSQPWSVNLLTGPIATGASSPVAWQGDGDYEISVRTTAGPLMAGALDICSKGQILVWDRKIIVN
jgi:hypothetical protein